LEGPGDKVVATGSRRQSRLEEPILFLTEGRRVEEIAPRRNGGKGTPIFREKPLPDNNQKERNAEDETEIIQPFSVGKEGVKINSDKRSPPEYEGESEPSDLLENIGRDEARSQKTGGLFPDLMRRNGDNRAQGNRSKGSGLDHWND